MMAKGPERSCCLGSQESRPRVKIATLGHAGQASTFDYSIPKLIFLSARLVGSPCQDVLRDGPCKSRKLEETKKKNQTQRQNSRFAFS